MMYYSAQTGGFYSTAIHGDAIPSDAVELTDEEYGVLLAEQSQGKQIKADSLGRPFTEELPPRTLATAKAQKIDALAALRYEKETAGIAVGTSTILTDRGSQAMVSGAAITAAILDPECLIDFKGANGWVQIDAATVLLIARAVSRHVQTRFSLERIHAETIEGLTTIATVDSYDITTGWTA